MTRFIQHAVALALILCCLTSLARAESVSPENRLANQLARKALLMIETTKQGMPVLPQTSQAALLLLDMALEVSPDEVENWRLALKIADIADDQPRIRRCLANIARLDPKDDVVRLRLINEVIGRYQTANDRVAAYERLLSGDPTKMAGAAVASRLALDLALLQQRVGRREEFSRWLTKATLWDPSNKAAAAMAAGYFRMNVNEPYAEAELIVNLLLADPIDLNPYNALAELLLDHGAYQSAARLYEIVIERGGTASQLQRVTDLSLAHLGARNPEAALEVLRRAQSRLDLVAQVNHKQENPDVEKLWLLENVTAPSPPELATVRAFIHTMTTGLHNAPAGRELPQETITLHDEAWGSITHAAQTAFRDILTAQEEAPEQVEAATQRFQNLFLQRAWIGLWYFAEFEPEKYVREVRASFEQAGQLLTLSKKAEDRFFGWTLLRIGRLDEAAERLTTWQEEDTAARAGVAMIHLAQGNSSDAIRLLISIQSEQPGSLLGIWARNKVEHLIGRELAVSDLATQLSNLTANIPSVFDRLAKDPTQAFDIRLVPAKERFDVYEPTIINVHLRNNAQLPLSIGPAGPIVNQVVVIPNVVRVLTDPYGRELVPIVIPIDRRLRLEPGEEFIIPLDLRRTYLVEPFFDSEPYLGATFRLRALSNFTTNRGGKLQQGTLGTKYYLRYPIEVRGIPGLSVESKIKPWISDTMVALEHPTSEDDPARIALFAHYVFDIAKRQQVQPEARTRQLIVSAFEQLDPISQAWLLGALPPPNKAGFPELDDAARKTNHPMVIASYLMSRLTDLHDPMLDAAARSDHDALRQFAELWLQRRKQPQQSPPATKAEPNGSTAP